MTSDERAAAPRLPSFLFIGPDKAGSTWLDAVLRTHPSVYIPAARDLYFFDRYFDRGLPWYARHFRRARPEQSVLAEICHDYLFDPQAAQRIRDTLPDVRLMVCLREPVARAFSSYLHMRRHGLVRSDFETALNDVAELIDNGAYWRHLAPYLELFGRDRIYIALFDDLKQDPQAFMDGLTDWLGIERMTLTAEQLEPRREASTARSRPVALLVKRSALLARELRLDTLIGVVKRSPLVQRALYRPMGDERPSPSQAAVLHLHAALGDDLAQLDAALGLDLAGRWHWPAPPPRSD
ncbi:MAG TPA: sulfotransferase [Mycobacteriales bacterium]|nr:sulfotransferase [Mycobacteriales bacterium]